VVLSRRSDRGILVRILMNHLRIIKSFSCVRVSELNAEARDREGKGEMTKRAFLLLATLGILLFLSACGGGNSTPPPPPPPVTYTISGTVFGLSGTGLTLQDNGSNNLPVSAIGAFTFSIPVVSGKTYNVTVSSQPAGPPQNCSVINGVGTASAKVTTVQVACVSDWMWVDGLDVKSVYGPYGSPPPGGLPGARENALTWTDSNGNFWLFGGDGVYAVQGGYTRATFSDLWEYSSGQWTLVSGTNAAGSSPVWGQIGVAAPGNTPGSRENAASWTDAAGNLWLFGASPGNLAYLDNDLWKYSPSAGEWTWVGGSNLANQFGTYGTMGQAAPGNIPGGRSGAVSWTDAAGNFWLFGGTGNDSVGTAGVAGSPGVLNDLWMYNPGTNEWTWMGGSNLANQSGIYGTMGVAAPGNIPGQRFAAVAWTDANGNFWLFGGMYWIPTGPGSGVGADYSDLWEYSPSTNEWTWMSGSNQIDQFGIYGTEGIASSSNAPGGRFSAVSWSDAKGNLWLFGGYGASLGSGGTLNDLWEYSEGQWTWMGGSNGPFQAGVYGTQGTAAPANIPGARNCALGWTDKKGNLWVFGGLGTDSTGTAGWLNDLWEYQP
jgi:hypothetical protein